MTVCLSGPHLDRGLSHLSAAAATTNRLGLANGASFALVSKVMESDDKFFFAFWIQLGFHASHTLS